MIRTGKAAVSALATVLVLGVCGVASAQGTQQQQPSGTQQQETGKLQGQEQFDRDKVTTKDRVQSAISEADQNLDALKKMQDHDKGADKKRDEDQHKKLSMLRDHLQKDLDKIDKSTMNDWSGVKPVVDRDLSAMDSELDRVAAITKVPRTGAAEKQPEQPSEQQQQPSQQQPQQGQPKQQQPTQQQPNQPSQTPQNTNQP